MASTSFSGINHGLQIGVHNGPINNLPPERPETPTSPLSTVPFARDRDFVSRETILRRIHEESLVPGSRIALVGLGGVGKSQLAIEYSYQVRIQSPATWVLWVHASNEARCEQSFQDIADQAKLPGRKDPNANIFKLVGDWLQDEKTGKWLCILDNVDDDQLLSSPAAVRGYSKTSSTKPSLKPILEYIPRNQSGSVIITSRSKEVAFKMVHHKGIIDIEPMEKSESLELLQRKLAQPIDNQETENQERQQLVDALEFMPLAIVQAASYIRNRAPLYSVSRYLRDFQNSDREAIKLLRIEAGYISRDWEAKNSILVTWQMSFDFLRQTKPSAADLLSFMSLFDRQGIPGDLIRHQHEANYESSSGLPDVSSDSKDSSPFGDSSDSADGETPESDIGPNFEDDVTALMDYSFISVSENNTFFTMHRLVQLATRAWLKSHDDIEHWRNRFISTLSDKFPFGEYKNWKTCRPLFPHVKSAMSQRPTSLEFQHQWATLIYNGASYAFESGNIADATEMVSRLRDQEIMLFGDEFEGTIHNTALLAAICTFTGQLEEAEELGVHLVETCKTKLGEDHVDTLSCMANLVVTYIEQRRWKEAEELETYVIEARKIKLGEKHPHTLASMSHLAMIYDGLCRWKEAEELELDVMESRNLKLGQDHPDTLMSICNLAARYFLQGRWKEAEEFGTHVTEARKIKLGQDHPDTLTSMSNLAVIYYQQGRWKEAEELELVVMERRKMKLGQYHPNTLASMYNLAFTWKSSGRDAEAINLLRDCITKLNHTRGPNHPKTLSSSKTLLEWEIDRIYLYLKQLDV